MKVEVLIAQLMGSNEPPNIAVTFKIGPVTIIRVEMAPTDFAMAITGRLVFGEATRGTVLTEHEGKDSK